MLSELECKALAFLRGRDGNPSCGPGPSENNAALIALLRSDQPLARDIRNQLAVMFNPASTATFKLEPARPRGRPLERVKKAIRDIEIAQAVELRLSGASEEPAAKNRKQARRDIANQCGLGFDAVQQIHQDYCTMRKMLEKAQRDSVVDPSTHIVVSTVVIEEGGKK